MGCFEIITTAFSVSWLKFFEPGAFKPWWFMLLPPLFTVMEVLLLTFRSGVTKYRGSLKSAQLSRKSETSEAKRDTVFDVWHFPFDQVRFISLLLFHDPFLLSNQLYNSILWMVMHLVVLKVKEGRPVRTDSPFEQYHRWYLIFLEAILWYNNQRRFDTDLILPGDQVPSDLWG